MTYESISNFMNLHESLCIAENENGETVIIERFKDDNNEYFYRMQIAQKNDWLRINEYYADGTVTETYER